MLRLDGAEPDAASVRSGVSVQGDAAGVAGRPVLWPAVVFGFVGAFWQARKAARARLSAGRYYAAAWLSALAWCAALSATRPVARLLLGPSLGRHAHHGWFSYLMLQRIGLLLTAVVIVGSAALVDASPDASSPRRPGPHRSSR